MRTLSIDIETFSSVDLIESGVYRYTEAPDFEILLLAYAYDGKPVELIDLAAGDMPEELYGALLDPSVIKTAFNASFEITCLNRFLEGYVVLDPIQWRCTMVHAYYLGIGGGLDGVAAALGIKNRKDAAGDALIKYFTKPCKATKINCGRTRNLPVHAPEKWEQFKAYCKQDVEVERELKNRLSTLYEIPDGEHRLWVLDQRINSRGVMLSGELITNAVDCDRRHKAQLMSKARVISGLNNPNSGAQVKKWLYTYEGKRFDSITKDNVGVIMNSMTRPESLEFLRLYTELSKTSVSKYETMAKCRCNDGRARGLLQFNGASRTGRWAGRLIQVHNLPKNELSDLDDARRYLLDGDYEALELLFPSMSTVLSEQIRTAFIPSPGKKLIVSDFSAIEARVIAWLAGEKWRLDVFNGHGKIYEASASQMFKVPIEQITKGSPLRQKGKIAELALGYQGGPGALIAMGALKMGLSEDELPELVAAWRAANRNIVSLWNKYETAAKIAMDGRATKTAYMGFYYKHGNLYARLPSGRELCYYRAVLGAGKFGKPVIKYRATNQTTRKFELTDTYGGKLTENIVQAIARDCLAEAMTRLDANGYEIIMHVHDEAVLEADMDASVDEVNAVMGEALSWAPGLPLKAAGFESNYYKKD